jgi:nucleoside-diphosphate-sugar epimerase
MAMTRYLITGGAGFIGSHLADALLAGGDEVVALDDLSTGRLSNLDSAVAQSGFRFVQGSVLDELIIDEFVYGCDVVIHLAAAVGVKLIVEQPLRSFTTNIQGTAVVIEAAHRYRRPVLLASTSEIYGKNGEHSLAETDDRILGSPVVARWAYSTAKAVDEILAYAYHRERGLPTKVVRLFNTVGPRQSPAYGMVIPRFIRQALAGQPITVFGDGSQSRCFGHVSDVVAALVGLLEREDLTGEVFNIGSQEEISILDLADRIIKRTSSRSPIRLVPYSDAYGEGFADMQRRVPDTTKIRRALGWTPIRSLDVILDEMIAEAQVELSITPAAVASS